MNHEKLYEIHTAFFVSTGIAIRILIQMFKQTPSQTRNDKSESTDVVTQ